MAAGRPFTRIAAGLLMVVALGHLYRLVRGLPVTVGHCAIPLWLSAAGMVAAAGLSVMLFREARR